MNVRVDTNPETRAAVAKLLCDELEDGASITRACDLVGVSYSMYVGWKAAAARGDDEAILLLRSMKTARARGQKALRHKIREAADEGDWKAAAWLIAHQYPDLRDGAPIEEIEVPDPQEPEVDKFGNKVDLSGYYSEKRRAMLDQITAEITGRSRQPQQPTAPPQPPKHALIEAALFTALAGWPGPRERGDVVAAVKAATKCDAVEVKQAATRLGVDEKQHSRLGAELRYTWELTRDLEESRGKHGGGREPTTMLGVDVGDYLRRRRGR